MTFRIGFQETANKNHILLPNILDKNILKTFKAFHTFATYSRIGALFFYNFFYLESLLDFVPWGKTT